MEDFENTNTQPEPLAEEPMQETEVIMDDDDEDFFPEEEGFDLPDPEAVITIRTSGGDTQYVPASAPMTVSEAMLASGLRPNGAVTYYLNGAEVKGDAVLPVGSTLTVVGSVKGGSK